MKPFGLTKRQTDALNFIAAYQAQHDHSPSFDEIRAGLDLKSKGDVHRLVHGLADRGAIRLLPNRPRSIALVERAA